MNELIDQFRATYRRDPEIIVHAPGRVNLIGEHVDYNDGPVLPAAINKEVTLIAAATADATLSLHALDLDQKISLTLENLEQKTSTGGTPIPKWAYFPAGVAWALQQAGLSTKGADVIYTSDVPIGAGLSSSAAVEVAFGLLWSQLGGWHIERLDLAQLCQRAENKYVGVSSGLMDQFASACGVEGHALYFDTRTLFWEPTPLPDNIAIIIADSGVRRSLSDSAYNQRREACEQAVKLLQQYKPGMSSLRDISSTEFMALSPYLPDEVRHRAEHVVKEIARVESARNALHNADIKIFGALMYASHISLRDLYDVSTPELDTLVEIAREIPGCFGARLTGAGFGGCTVNIVDQDFVKVFVRELISGYKQLTGRAAHVYECLPSKGVWVEETGL